jgi:hypothetical protein
MSVQTLAKVFPHLMAWVRVGRGIPHRKVFVSLSLLSYSKIESRHVKTEHRDGCSAFLILNSSYVRTYISNITLSLSLSLLQKTLRRKDTQYIDK